jgi:hypothetical protein
MLESLVMLKEAELQDPWPVAAMPANITVVPKEEDNARANTKRLEQELLTEAFEILRGAFRLKEIDEDTKEVPVEWVDEYGTKKAKEMFRMAKGAWKPKKEAPLGIQVAQEMAIGILRARAREEAPKAVLNMSMVSMSFELPVFPVKKVER